MNKETLLEEMKQGIKDVIDGVTSEFESDFLTPSYIDEFIMSKYGIRMDDIDSNGWQWDYWITYYINNVRYMLCGSGFYGGLRFSKYGED